MGNWNWLRIGTMALGALTLASSFIFPVAAPITGPIGAGLMGVALRAPGTLNKDTAVQIGCQVADAAVNAAVANAGGSGATLRSAVGSAANTALVQALPPK